MANLFDKVESAPSRPHYLAADMLARLRQAGWTVAVHNDYRVDGVPHTFWLFTHGTYALFAKGEGLTDATALDAATDAAGKAMDSLRALHQRADDGKALASRIVGKLSITRRWPCPDCGRKGPDEPLVLVMQQGCMTDHKTPTTEVHFTGCVRCVDHDELIAQARRLLGLE